MNLQVSSDSEIQIADKPPKVFQSGFNERVWLKNRGKQDFINFSDDSLGQLRKYFNSLDQKGTGSLGVEQLQDPFIAFGLSDSREEVEKLINSVDLDGSGTIQFDQFLQIMLKIKRGKSENQNSAMFDFFQKMSTGKLGEDYDNDLSFRLNVSQFRRRKLLDSIMSQNKQKKDKGETILKNFKKQIITNPETKKYLTNSKNGKLIQNGFPTKGAKNKK